MPGSKLSTHKLSFPPMLSRISILSKVSEPYWLGERLTKINRASLGASLRGNVYIGLSILVFTKTPEAAKQTLDQSRPINTGILVGFQIPMPKLGEMLRPTT